MKTLIVMRRILPAFLMLLLSVVAHAQLKLTLHVAQAGTLPSLISEADKYNIDDLTLTGDLNGTDILFLREVMGRNYEGDKSTPGILSRLDISGANIVNGGVDYAPFCGTSENVIGLSMFKWSSKLNYVSLPRSVTYIDSSAFKDCRELKTVKINGEGVYYTIRTDVFKYCYRLREIHLEQSVPPRCFSESFEGVYKNLCQVFVPEGSSDSYRNAEGWRDFENIIERTTSVSDISADDILVYAVSGSILIKNVCIGQTVSVYTVAGSLVKTVSAVSGEMEVSVPSSGAYLVKIDDSVFKVIL